MKKRYLLALTVLLALSFAACGKDKGSDTSSSGDSSIESSSSVEDGSSEVTPETYSFTKVINMVDRVNGTVMADLEEGATLDLTEPTAEGKVFKGWIDAEGNAITVTEMPAGNLTIFAKWEITPYTVTVKNAAGDVLNTYTFGVDDCAATDTTPEIIGIDSLTWVLGMEYADTASIYTIADIPETWELRDYELTATKNENVSKAVSVIVANASKVTNGTIETTTEYDSGTMNTITTTFELAENYAHLQEGDAHKWFMGYGDGKVLWLQDLYGYGVSKAYYEAKPEMVNGYAFETIFDYTHTYYGVENFIAAIYGLSKPANEAYAEGVYTFSMEYVNDNAVKYVVTVGFSVNDAGVLSSATIKIEKHTKDYVYENDEPVVDEDGNPVMEYQLLNTTTYTVTQGTTAEVTVAYDPEVLLLKSYTLQKDGEEVSEFTMNAGDSVTLNFADVPEGANIAYETFTITVTDGEGIEVEDSWNAPFSAFVSTYSSPATLNISANAADTYTVTIESAFVTKTFTVTVETPAPTEIKAVQDYSTLTSADIYDDATLTFTVQAQNQYADASATVEIKTQPDGADATLESVGNDYTFKPDGVGTYVLLITSDVDDTLTSEVTIKVTAAPSVEELFDDDNYQYVGYWGDTLKVHFITGANDVINVVAWFDGEDRSGNVLKTMAVYTATYDAATKAFALTAVEDMQAKATELGHDLSAYTPDATLLNSVTVQADYTLKVVFNNNRDMGTLEVCKAEEETGVDISGEYSHIIFDDETALPSVKYVLTLNNDGTATLNAYLWNSGRLMWVYNSEKGEAAFNYVYNAGTGSFMTDKVESSFDGFDMRTTIVVNTNENTITVTLNDVELVFEK